MTHPIHSHNDYLLITVNPLGILIQLLATFDFFHKIIIVRRETIN